jgi:hypothetical protein
MKAITHLILVLLLSFAARTSAQSQQTPADAAQVLERWRAAIHAGNAPHMATITTA